MIRPDLNLPGMAVDSAFIIVTHMLIGLVAAYVVVRHSKLPLTWNSPRVQSFHAAAALIF